MSYVIPAKSQPIVVEHEEMSVATQYFHQQAEAEFAAAMEAKKEEKVEIMPAAIQKFTLAAREESMKKKMELEELKKNPEPLAPGVAHFTMTA